MATATNTTAPVLKPYVETDQREFMRVLIVGIGVGILVPLIGMLVSNFIIKPLFCASGATSGVCTADGSITGYHTAAIVVGLAAVALFANWGIFRPLPLVVAVTISLWGLQQYLDPLRTGSWLEFFLFSVALSTLCYLLFYWIMRLRNFPVSMIVAALVTVAIFWVFTI